MQKVTTVRENVLSLGIYTGTALSSSWFGELRLGMRQSKAGNH